MQTGRILSRPLRPGSLVLARPCMDGEAGDGRGQPKEHVASPNQTKESGLEDGEAKVGVAHQSGVGRAAAWWNARGQRKPCRY